MEIIYFWLLGGEEQKNSKFYYQPGQENLGDYHTKPFTGKYTQRARPFYLHGKISPRCLVRALMPSTRRGFVENIGIPYIHRKPQPNLPRVRS